MDFPDAPTLAPPLTYRLLAFVVRADMTLLACLLLAVSAVASPTPPDLVARWDHSALGSQAPTDAQEATAGRYATLIALHGAPTPLAKPRVQS